MSERDRPERTDGPESFARTVTGGKKPASLRSTQAPNGDNAPESREYAATLSGGKIPRRHEFARTVTGHPLNRQNTVDPGVATEPVIARSGSNATTKNEVVVTVNWTADGKRSTPRFDSQVGPQLEARFTVGDSVGSGAMGEVYQAHDDGLNRDLAVKVLGKNRAANDIAVTRFMREAQVTAQLSHPHVVPVYGLERTAQDEPALAMKLIRGETFADYIKRCREATDDGHELDDSLAVSTRVEHFLKVCDAIAYSHDRGVMHRDIKPDNVMLGPFGEVYVMDWGMAGVRTADDDAFLADPAAETLRVDDASLIETRAGSIMGTPLYMAPEQARGETDRVGARSDQYSLAIVLYELTALRRARPGKNLGEVLMAARKGTPLDFDGLQPAIAADLRAILDRATSSEPRQRYPSVQAFADDVRRFVRGDEVSVRPDNWSRRSWRKLRRRPVAAMSTLLAVVLLASFVTTASLYRVVTVQKQAAVDQETVAELIAKLGSHARDVDAELFGIQVLLEGIATATRDRYQEFDSAKPPPFAATETDLRAYGLYSHHDLAQGRGPADTTHHARYDQAISFTDGIYLATDASNRAEVMPRLHHMSQLQGILRAAVVRSVNPEAIRWPDAKANKLISDKARLTWAYVGFADGTMLNYPGNAIYASGYDPRMRPWYTSSVGRIGPKWGEIYSDAAGTGFLMPCNEPVYDRNGELIGVAGLDMGLDAVIAALEVPDIAAVKRTFIVDQQARVVFSSDDLGKRSATDKVVTETRARSPFDVPKVAEQVRSGRVSGAVRLGPDLYVFSRLRSLQWTLVAQLEANHYLR